MKNISRISFLIICLLFVNASAQEPMNAFNPSFFELSCTSETPSRYKGEPVSPFNKFAVVGKYHFKHKDSNMEVYRNFTMILYPTRAFSGVYWPESAREETVNGIKVTYSRDQSQVTIFGLLNESATAVKLSAQVDSLGDLEATYPVNCDEKTPVKKE
jgi:hypothetical protein